MFAQFSWETQHLLPGRSAASIVSIGQHRAGEPLLDDILQHVLTRFGDMSYVGIVNSERKIGSRFATPCGNPFSGGVLDESQEASATEN